MGEFAEAMIDGEMCEGCGVYIGHSVGYSRKCKACKKEEQNEKKEKDKK